MFIVLMLFAFSVCSGLYIITFSSDRENKLRYLYNFIGLKPLAYLLGNLIFDIIPYTISTGVFMGMLFIMDLRYLSHGWQAVMGIMMSFGF
jgi:hypothetical protein